MSDLIKLSAEAQALIKTLFVADEDGNVAINLKLVDKATYTERAFSSSKGSDISTMLNKCLEYEPETGITSLICAVDPVEVAALAGV